MSKPGSEREQQFLYAEDFLADGVWKDAKLTIREVVEPGTLRTADKKPVLERSLRFEKSNKILVLNRTNTRMLKLLFGTEKAENWAGQRVTLYAAIINCFGQDNVPCVRVRLPQDRPIPFGLRKFLGKDLTGTKIEL